jgi:segregation and condensation protein B
MRPQDAVPDAAEAGDLARSYGSLVGRDTAPLAGEEPDVGRVLSAEETGPSPPPLARILEAILFVGGAPLTAARACETVRGLTPAQFSQTIDGLNRDYRLQGRPYRIQPREQGFELVLLPRFRGVHERLYGSTREARLSGPALDVLALVAYRQPATRQEVEGLRGSDCGSPLRQLVRLGLIAVQRGDAGRREAAYGTTPRFLKLFGLRNLDDLPRTQDVQKM